MELTLTAFGIAKDILGEKTTIFSLEGDATVEGLLASLKKEYPKFEQLTSLMVAVNEEYATGNHPLSPKDEIVLIPPVSGG